MVKPVEVPKDWIPLLKWRRWFYPQQVQYLDAAKNHWEIVFLAGNGVGKSLIFYWDWVATVLNAHPHQYALPPLRIKILIHDFEHGYGKIFRDTVMRPLVLPERWAIVNDQTGGFLNWYAEKRRVDEYCRTVDVPYRIDRDPEEDIGPILPLSMIDKEPSRDDRTLYLKNGSFIFFQTSEQKKRLHSGTNFDGLGADEEPEYQVYDESKRGLRRAKGGGKIKHAFTPPFDDETKNKGPTWTKFKLIEPFEKGEDRDIYVVRASVYDNPALTDAWIERFSKGKTEQQLRIQLHGEYPTWGALIFPEYQDFMWEPKQKTGHLLPYDFNVPWDDPDCLFEMGLDWHGSKPPAVIWSFEYRHGPNKGDVIVFDEISPQESRGMTISQVSQAIREHEGWRHVRIRRHGDPKMKDKNNALISGFSPWDEFRHCGIRLSEGWNRDPYVGYSIINDFFRGKGKGFEDHPRLFVKENCNILRHQLKNHYNVPKNDGTSIPDPQFSDFPVCLKYVMQSKSRKIKKNMDKSGSFSRMGAYANDPDFRAYVTYA